MDPTGEIIYIIPESTSLLSNDILSTEYNTPLSNYAEDESRIRVLTESDVSFDNDYWLECYDSEDRHLVLYFKKGIKSKCLVDICGDWEEEDIKLDNRVKINTYILKMDEEQYLYEHMGGIEIVEMRMTTKFNKLFIFDKTGFKRYWGGFRLTDEGLVYRDGFGRDYREGKLHYEGSWKDDIPNGEGKLYNEDGTVRYDGIWNKGFILRKNGRYCYLTGELENGCVEYYYPLSLIIIGAIMIIGAICLSFDSDNHDHLGNDLSFFFTVSFYYFYAAFLHFPRNLLCSTIAFISNILFAFIELFLFFVYEQGNISYYTNLSILYVILCVLAFYIHISFCVLFFRFIRLFPNVSPSEDNCICSKKGIFVIMIEFFIGLILFIQFCKDTSSIHDYCKTTSIWYCVFVFLNSLFYCSISYLHLYDDRLFDVGIWSGCIWGIISCIIAIVFGVFEMKNSSCNDHSHDLLNIACYTWILTLTSLLLCYLNKPSTGSPVVQPTTPMEQSVSPMVHSISSLVRSVSPMVRSISPMTRSVSPMMEPLTPI